MAGRKRWEENVQQECQGVGAAVGETLEAPLGRRGGPWTLGSLELESGDSRHAEGQGCNPNHFETVRV